MRKEPLMKPKSVQKPKMYKKLSLEEKKSIDHLDRSSSLMEQDEWKARKTSFNNTLTKAEYAAMTMKSDFQIMNTGKRIIHSKVTKKNSPRKMKRSRTFVLNQEKERMCK